MGPTTDDLVEEQNEALTRELASKVNRLKNLAFEIETETKEHNALLGSMADDFESSGNLLGMSVGRVKNLLRSGSSNRKTMCYVGIFIFMLFMFVYYTSSLLRRG